MTIVEQVLREVENVLNEGARSIQIYMHPPIYCIIRYRLQGKDGERRIYFENLL